MSAVRPPKQRRSRESYERVLDAAHTLLEENGFDGFTIQEVAARSGVSVGAIYERFGNKESLLRSVHARLMESMSEANAAAEASDERVRTDAAEAIVARRRRDGAGHERQPQGAAGVHAPRRGRRGDLRPRVGGEHRAEQGVQADADAVRGRSSVTPIPRSRSTWRSGSPIPRWRGRSCTAPCSSPIDGSSWKRLVDELGAVCAVYLLSAPVI